jgi:hypothetical protein
LLLTAGLALWFEPFLPLVGDLTRVGNYAEQDFGWVAPQPPIHVLANGHAMADPDILVLGDSFSRSNIWQSVVAAQSARKIQSFEIARVGCIRHWFDYALAHPTAKTIVIESVERSFLTNFKTLANCDAAVPAPFETGEWTSAARRASGPPEWHIQRTFRVSFNTLEMQLHPHDTIHGEQVGNAPIDPRCARYSNRRADRLLYFSQDEEKFAWSRDDLAQATANIVMMQKMAAQHGKEFVLMLVPDKLTAYQQCLVNVREFALDKGPNITGMLLAAGVRMPDLQHSFRENIGKIEDLYRPNDTHLSEAGYLLMAENMTRLLSRQSD